MLGGEEILTDGSMVSECDVLYPVPLCPYPTPLLLLVFVLLLLLLAVSVVGSDEKQLSLSYQQYW